MSQALTIGTVDYPFPAKPAPLSSAQQQEYVGKIKQLLIDKNATLVSHYYTDPEIQALTEQT
ncbi:MAG: quinolinate synthase, partial [Paraglaciecola sp.]